jgi:hypothetical protein
MGFSVPWVDGFRPDRPRPFPAHGGRSFAYTPVFAGLTTRFFNELATPQRREVDGVPAKNWNIASGLQRSCHGLSANIGAWLVLKCGLVYTGPAAWKRSAERWRRDFGPSVSTDGE